MNKRDASLIEPLTRRESEILTLLADFRLTNEDIASRLFLSVHSIKWHARQIYAKLDATNRRAAVRQAYDVGILGDMAPEAAPDSRSTAATIKLPLELTSFVGRQAEIDQILHLLEHSTARLITIAGVGGSGKTRLALKVAETILTRDDIPDSQMSQQEILLVELATINEASQIVERAAQVCGLPTTLGQSTLDALISALKPRPALLVMDNCEHLIEASASLVTVLLKSCPRLRVLTTSREVLGIPGERVYWLSPLTFPTDSLELTTQQALQYEAIQLFLERATATLPEFKLTAENVQPIAKICRQVDGLPLALELTAARVRLMSVAQIAERLAWSLNTSTGGFRSALPQHKTMRASIEWSFSLLSAAEQCLLLRLSVFRGEWSLESAEAVCSDQTSNALLLPTDAVLQTLCGLVDKSLVIRSEAAATGIHFRLLASISQFAREKLEQSGELAQMQRRHLAYLLEMPVDDPDMNGLIAQLKDISPNWDQGLLTHNERLMQLGLHLAEKAKIHDPVALLHFRRGAVLHDIGKLLVPEKIIQKSTSFNAEDWEQIRRHPIHAIHLLQPYPVFQRALDIPAYHHECWDGSGYPHGLRGEDIPLAARVFTIANIWDALRSERPFRQAFSHAQAHDILITQSGTTMDSHLVNLFLEIIHE